MRLLFTTIAIATGLAGVAGIAAPAEAQPRHDGYHHDGYRHGPGWHRGYHGPRHDAYWRHRTWREHHRYHHYYGRHR